MRMTLIPWLVLCCLHFTFNALSIITQASYYFSHFYLPICCFGWNLIQGPSPCNVLHITKLIYLHGHIHIFIHSHSHQSLHRETLNQDSPFKQTNELWITPLHKLPSLECYEDRKIGRVEKKGMEKWECGWKTFCRQEQKGNERRQGVWDRKQQRGEHTEKGGWETQGKRSVCI